MLSSKEIQNSFYDLVICKDEDPFVDKTDLIADLNKCLAKSQKKFKAVTRPRRFGKTVTARMLELYYSNNFDPKEVKEIFAGLKISQDPSFLEHLNKYTVIYWDMNLMNGFYKEELDNNDNKNVNFVKVIKSKTIEILRKNKKFNEVLSKNPKIGEYSLMSAIIELNEKLGERFICIIDEWDLIFRNFKDDLKLQYDFIELLNDLFKAETAGNCFSLVYMTGILPIKKYESHSLLNNFKEYNMLEPLAYAKYFGFTDDEVKELVKKYNTSLTYDNLKEWYDGYKLEGLEIYNPYSVYNAIVDNRTLCYFNTTASNKDAEQLINLNVYGLYDDILKLTSGQKVPFSSKQFENNLTKIESRDDVYCLLTCLGYLACIDLPSDYKDELDKLNNISEDAVKDYNKLAFIPNKEIETIFEGFKKSESWKKTLESIKLAKEVANALTQMDEETVQNIFNKYYLSEKVAKNDRRKEAILRKAFVDVLNPYAENKYAIKQEDSAGLGFADAIYYPLPFTNIKPNFPIIIEFKVNKSSDVALNQIIARQYYESCSELYKDIILVGLNYNSKDRKCECKITKYSDLEPNLK